MVSVWALCVIVFVLSDLGFVLSLREVELRTRSWCPEVALEILGVTFQVSIGRFKIFISRRPDVASFRLVILSRERGLGVHMLL